MDETRKVAMETKWRSRMAMPLIHRAEKNVKGDDP
jgi:hypothetical protein